MAESTALDPKPAVTGSRQPSEVAAVVYKETLGIKGGFFEVRIGNNKNPDFGITIYPYNAQVAYKIFDKGYTPVEFMPILNPY